MHIFSIHHKLSTIGPRWPCNAHLITSQVLSELAFRFNRKSSITDFQDGGHGGHLGFPIGIFLTIFDLQVTSILPMRFQENWPFNQEKKIKINFIMAAMAAILDMRFE